MKFPANFLVVRVRPPGWKLGLFIPLPLFVLEEALEAASYLARAWSWAGGKHPRIAVRIFDRAGIRTWAEVLHIPMELIRSLRSHGSFTIAEVRDGSTHVSVRLV